jgi:uncharacterized protein with PQ loop repeat
MYNSKAASAIGAGSLAYTGVNSMFWVLTAILIIIVGITIYRLARSRPSFMKTGPKAPTARRWSIRKK